MDGLDRTNQLGHVATTLNDAGVEIVHRRTLANIINFPNKPTIKLH